ncbi:MAG: hypothetical protein ACP5FZ_12395 [Fidelibacterota bacterium]
MAVVTIKTIMPGQYGTKRLSEKYGEQLLAVRYRLDRERRKKLKTVEIVVDEWDYRETDKKRISPDKSVHLFIEYGEKELGVKIRRAGGFWNKEKRYWELPYGRAVQLGLADRIIDD